MTTNLDRLNGGDIDSLRRLTEALKGNPEPIEESK